MPANIQAHVWAVARWSRPHDAHVKLKGNDEWTPRSTRVSNDYEDTVIHAETAPKEIKRAGDSLRLPKWWAPGQFHFESLSLPNQSWAGAPTLGSNSAVAEEVGEQRIAHPPWHGWEWSGWSSGCEYGRSDCRACDDYDDDNESIRNGTRPRRLLHFSLPSRRGTVGTQTRSSHSAPPRGLLDLDMSGKGTQET